MNSKFIILIFTSVLLLLLMVNPSQAIWVDNSDVIVSGLSKITPGESSDHSSPHVFNDSGTLKMFVSSDDSGSFGHVWNGTCLLYTSPSPRDRS